MSVADLALLLAAGLAAGLSGTVAGLGSLFSYPALLATGMPATAANVTNTVALAFGTVSAVPSSRAELDGQRSVLWRLAVPCACGSAAGAALLLATPPGVFEKVVPLLVGGAAVLIMLPTRPPRHQVSSGPAAAAGVFAVSVYSGYFAAASGVLMLALLLVTSARSESFPRANALRNALMVVADAVAALGFAAFGPVRWAAVPPLVAGLLAGSWLGPSLVRRVPAGPLRVAVGVAGLGLAVHLALDAF
ncbi:sulfite exporter TauE/SafE family protein [Streptomyces sp. NPDC048172]|uniref:sulfite exporter TauE/SafE family protein n=1 Tax=Streptomyces sp. NPDC048172 TaxID=3365505 RepID=UPI003719A356